MGKFMSTCSLVAGFFLLPACATTAPPKPHVQDMAWTELAGRAGQRVRLCGWFQAGMEECALAPSREALNPERQAWVLARGRICLPEHAVLNPTKSWAEVTGTLSTGNNFGHLGMYAVLLDDAVVTLRKEACPADP